MQPHLYTHYFLIGIAGIEERLIEVQRLLGEDLTNEVKEGKDGCMDQEDSNSSNNGSYSPAEIIS